MKLRRVCTTLIIAAFVCVMATSVSGQGSSVGNRRDGQQLFERETFGGNGRTCLTCHSRATGTVSPEDVQARFQSIPRIRSSSTMAATTGRATAYRGCLPMQPSS
jgi:hypothetical protein